MRATYSGPAAPGAGLSPHVSALDPRTVAGLAPDLADRCARYLAQRFDLLGSGWRTVIHGAACEGFEGRRYRAAAVGTDAGGRWLAGQVTRRNLRRARSVWRLLDPGYRPIDWHLDFRSGYRWSPLVWYLRVPYGHLPGVDVKVPWELARMQHLPQVALAFGCARAGLPRFLPPERYRGAFRNQVLDFVATNPPRWGVNWRSTMEVAIRIANWLLAYDLFRAYGAEFDRGFEAVFAASVREHGRHVAHNLDRSPAWRNNHYLADLAGLAFVAGYLPPTRETRRWGRAAAAGLARETGRQFLGDGAHFESSTGYHALAAQLVAWAAAMIRAGERGTGPPAAGPAVPGAWPGSAGEALSRMAEFLVDVTRPDGRLVQIGDQDGGRLFKLQPAPRLAGPGAGRRAGPPAEPDEEHLVPSPVVAAIGGLLGRPDLARRCAGRWLDELVVAGLAGASPRRGGGAPARTGAARAAARLGPGFPGLSRRLRTEPAVESSRVELAAPGASLLSGLRALAYPDFGAYVFRSDRLFLCVRAGPASGGGTGGHAHVDQLGLEVCVDGVAWLRDPGSYVYTPSPRQRNAYRSSAAHFVPYALEGEEALLNGGLFDLPLDVRLPAVAVGPHGLAVELVLAGNRLGQLVTIGAQAVAVETWIYEVAGPGRPQARCRPGWAGRRVFRGEAARGAVAYCPGYGVRETGEGRGA